MTDDIALIDNPKDVIRDLDQMWAVNPPRSYRNEMRRPLWKSDHDQKTVHDNPYWEIVRNLPVDSPSWCGSNHAVEVDGYACMVGRDYIVSRNRLTKTYAWAIPTPGDISWITSHLDGRGVVEIGAGTGYWAWQLSQAGADVIAYDEAPLGNDWCGEVQYHPVLKGGTDMASVYSSRVLMLCWPPYASSMAAKALDAYDGDSLIYIGEGQWGCTADDEFFAAVESGWELAGSSPHHVTFSGIHCFVEFYRRKDGGS